ncbi:Haloacid Dehalogenase superfamily, subfamily IB, phosphoserine phosphatase-like [Chitinophaga ginsengisegetis]|uniref:Haloacid Dehalogenase superfamily, subfamily IB, phosphoserine phosphatase-like n=1 Tax=Chitinophaga ginsengisegetis TaxID=393003 RepID=A0A1T5P5B6_9BACT|nr:HAD-IB family phosphatase [Chitinophaga ginsengisegetis]SKD07895.1 Haloacid Dehalogenase superfamily, subfamily IB, phosphoserine phosphatase-like [Chitinophaga ginsengisegetis]
MISDKRIVIFDLCGTLYDSNTTMDFIREKVFSEKRQYRLFNKVSHFIGWKVFNKVLYKLLGLDLTRVIFVRSLKGYARTELNLLAEEFIKTTLSNKEITIAQEMLRNEMAQEKRVAIVSASMDFLVQAIAKELGVKEYYATTLDFASETGICNGRILHDLLGNKLETCRLHNLDVSKAFVITDNLSDAELVSKSSEAFIVAKKKNELFWTKFPTVKEIYVFDR